MMSARRMLLDLALTAYPRSFRAAYRGQILNDVEESEARPLGAAMNLVLGGISMRADLFARDVRYAMRRLLKMPLFAAIVGVTFALGIGANVAVFSILNTVLLRPLPYPNISRLVVMRVRNTHQAGVGSSLSVPELNDFIAQSKTLGLLAASAPDGATMTGIGKPRALMGYDVTPNYFAALGVQPQLGRFLTEADERKGVASAVISDRLWRGSFAADPHVVGRTLRLDGIAFTIVGVAPAAFRVPDAQRGTLVPADYWTAQPDKTNPNQRGATYLGVLGVLQPGASLQTANAELAVISQRLQRQYPNYEAGSTYSVMPLSQLVLGNISSALWTVFAAVLGILIIACANVASMLLTSASSRDREFAVRSALGASHRSLAEQLLIETGALALLGGIAGVALAYGILGALRPSLAILPHVESLRIDTSALLYGLGVVMVCTLLSGLWPVAALRLSTQLQSTLKAAGRSGTAAAGNRLRTGLVVTEIAVALALLVLSGLVVRSYFSLVNSDLGVTTRGILATTVLGLPSHRYRELSARAAFEDELLKRLQAIPGVDSAAIAVTYPLSNIMVQFQIGIVGRVFPTNQEPSVAENTITPAYFRTLGIPILTGRPFSDADTAASEPVAIVNQTFARLYGKNGNVLGMRIKTPGWNGTAHATRLIVGVAADTRSSLEEAPRPVYYAPLRQAPPDLLSAIVRTSPGMTAGVSKAVQYAIEQTDREIAAPDVQSFADLVAQHSEQQRSIATLLSSLGIVALLLALFGIFGVVSYGVSQRYGEFGIRVALGARSMVVLTDVLVRALSMTAVGVCIGVVIAFFGAQAVASQLYRVSPIDPVTFIGVIALIAVCSALAALFPAMRAVRIDPAVTLRYE